MDPTLQFVGRLHPLVVHFPIALILAAVPFQLFRRRRSSGERPAPPVGDAAFACLATGALGAIVACTCGWLYAENDPPARGLADVLWLHRWIGIAAAAVASIATLLALRARRSASATSSPVRTRAFHVALFGAAGLVSGGAHFGGEMVYGDDFLFEVFEREAPKRTKETKSIERVDEGDGGEPVDPPDSAGGPGVTGTNGGGASAESDAGTVDQPIASAVETDDRVDYLRDVLPIFEAHCFECHGPTGRAKGGLRLSDMEDVFSGDEDLWVIVPNDSSKSLLVDLISLPEGDDELMPPDGPPLAAEEIALIARWIDAGAQWVEIPAERLEASAPADEPATDEDGGADPTTGQPARLTSGETEQASDGSATEDASAPDATSGDANAAPAAPDASASSTPAAAAAPLTDARVAELRAAIVDHGGHLGPVAFGATDLEANLGLAGERTTDATLALLAGLEPRLVALDLSGTSVTDDGVRYLRRFTRLEWLRLDGTRITDVSGATLATLTALEYLNLVGTEVTDELLVALRPLAKLRSLHLWRTRVTDAGVRELEDALPELATERGAQ